jgi:exosortase/archaeosortase family protein
VLSDRRPSAVVLAGAALLLLALPLVATFDDLLAVGAVQARLAGPLDAVAPLEARMAAALLGWVGIRAGVSGPALVLVVPHGAPLTLWITWNCVGWQSLVLFAISLATGLRGGLRWDVRVQVVLTGLAGTVLVNVLRMAVVAIVATVVGSHTAVLLHDYGGTLLVVAWLLAFWAGVDRWLVAGEEAEE